MHDPLPRLPLNELPVTLPTEFVWHGPGAVVAIPALMIYTTGVEMYVLYRAKGRQQTGIESARVWRRKLGKLSADGAPIDVLGVQYSGFGFTAHAWSPFASHWHESPIGDIEFRLDWPGFEPVIHSARGVRAAASRVRILWNHVLLSMANGLPSVLRQS
jgi:hypothetical protein